MGVTTNYSRVKWDNKRKSQCYGVPVHLLLVCDCDVATNINWVLGSIYTFTYSVGEWMEMWSNYGSKLGVSVIIEKWLCFGWQPAWSREGLPVCSLINPDLYIIFPTFLQSLFSLLLHLKGHFLYLVLELTLCTVQCLGNCTLWLIHMWLPFSR